MKIFLSYPSEQLETARDVYAFLTSLEVDVWFDKESLVAGQDWAREISKAQTEADLIVQICSAEIANKTGVIQKELKETLELLKLRPLGSLYLICIKTDEANLPPELIKFQHITYSDKNWQVNLVKSLLSKFKEIGSEPPHNLANYKASVGLSEANEPTLLTYKDNTPHWEIYAKYIQFNIGNDYWRYINSEIIQAVFERIYFVRGDFGWRPAGRKLEASFQLDEFFRSGDFVSLRFLIYTDYAGAHAGWWTKTRNFFGPSTGKLSIKDLFSPTNEVLTYLTEYVALDLRRQGGADLTHLTEISRSKNRWTEKEDLWSKFEQYNYDLAGITFNFSPGTIYNWAGGDFTVRVPWDTLINYLAPRLKEAPIGRLLSSIKPSGPASGTAS